MHILYYVLAYQIEIHVKQLCVPYYPHTLPLTLFIQLYCVFDNQSNKFMHLHTLVAALS